MNLYIINDVLHDYTAGMAVIAAESMPHCETIFMNEFGYESRGPEDDVYAEQSNQELQKEFNTARIKVIENVNDPEGVVAYEYGGG